MSLSSARPQVLSRDSRLSNDAWVEALDDHPESQAVMLKLLCLQASRDISALEPPSIAKMFGGLADGDGQELSYYRMWIWRATDETKSMLRDLQKHAEECGCARMPVCACCVRMPARVCVCVHESSGYGP